MGHLWKMNWPDDKLINQNNGSIWWMNYNHHHHQSLTVSFGQSEFIFINKILFSWITIRSIDQFKSCLISDISVRSIIIIIFGFYAHTHMIFEQIFSTIFVFFRTVASFFKYGNSYCPKRVIWSKFENPYKNQTWI